MQEYRDKIIHSRTKGLITNLAHDECDLMSREACRISRFEQTLNEEFQSIVPQIEQMGQIRKYKYFSEQDVIDIESEFFEQDKLVPKVSSFIEHIEGLEFVKFDDIDDDLPKDVSV